MVEGRDGIPQLLQLLRRSLSYAKTVQAERRQVCLDG